MLEKLNNYLNFRNTLTDDEFFHFLNNSKEQDHRRWFNRPWKEWKGKKLTFYSGFFYKGEYQFGITVGTDEGCIDLGIWTIGYLKL